MNKDFVKDFRPEDGRMDRVKKVLKKEGVYMGRYMDEKGDYCDAYNSEGCTFFVYDKKIRVWGKLPVTILYSSSQLEKKVGIELKEIK